ncbi:MAG: hypothetical protein KBS81_00720, partial [Spirochaetales bacterium]|nr:hypothetical protein [Candidatus Physcosoma equi]
MIDRKRLERRNPDAALKKLVEHADCFCDVVNYFLEDGDKITPDQVESFEEKNLYRREKGLKQTERDVVKIVKGIGKIRVVIGVENQCYEDVGLPLR